MLGALNNSREGRILYNLVYQILLDQDRSMQASEERFHTILEHITAYCLSQAPDNVEMRLRLTLLRKLSTPPFVDIGLDTLFATGPVPGAALSPAGLDPELEQLFGTAGIGLDDLAVPDARSADADETDDTADEPSVPETLAATQGVAGFDVAVPVAEREPELVTTVTPMVHHWKATPEAEMLSRTSGELTSLRDQLLRRMVGTSEQYDEFTRLLDQLLEDLKTAKSPEQLEALRNILKRKVRRMIKEHNILTENISATGNGIEQFEIKCQQLNRELGEAKQMSLTDELTGLPNRRAFLRRLANETGRVQRYGYPLAVAMLDLDMFKEINDTHGHEAGDAVLRCYTDEVLSTFRNYDMVARYGGEEFAVLLPHTDAKGAERALNKVRKRAAETTFNPANGDTAFNLPTFSAGVAMYQPGESASALIDRADQAMYDAKRQGRNRVELVLS